MKDYLFSYKKEEILGLYIEKFTVFLFISLSSITYETKIHKNNFYHSEWWIKIFEKYYELYEKMLCSQMVLLL